MSEQDREDTAGESAPADRRANGDRRPDASESRRGQKQQRWKSVAKIVGRDTALVIGTLGAILVGLRATHPIFANQPSVVQALAKSATVAPIAKVVLDSAPKDSTVADIVSSPQFERDRKAFAA